MVLKTVAELEPYGSFGRKLLRPLFTSRGMSQPKDLQTCVTSLQAILAAGHDADVCVEVGPRGERWLVVARAQGGTTGERILSAHQLILCFHGSDEVRMGAGELMVRALKPGDLLWIPAGTPHEHIFAPQSSLVAVQVLPETAHNMPLLREIRNRECVHYAEGYLRHLLPT